MTRCSHCDPFKKCNNGELPPKTIVLAGLDWLPSTVVLSFIRHSTSELLGRTFDADLAMLVSDLNQQSTERRLTELTLLKSPWRWWPPHNLSCQLNCSISAIRKGRLKNGMKLDAVNVSGRCRMFDHWQSLVCINNWVTHRTELNWSPALVDVNCADCTSLTHSLCHNF